MKVYLIDLGREELDKNNLIAGATMGGVSDKTPSPIWTWTPMWCTLIDHPDLGWTLFDTGVSPKWETNWSEFLKELSPYYTDEEHLLLPQLARIGLKPEDVKTIIISHLHSDHSGGLEFFPHADIYIHEDELAHVLDLYATDPERTGVYIWNEIHTWMDQKLHWKKIKRDDDLVIPLAKGISIVNLGSGHTPGMMGLLLELENTGNVLFTSDSLYSGENDTDPITLPGICYDTLGYKKTAEKIHKVAKEYNATIWYGHDQKQWQEHKKLPEYYD